MNNETYAEWLVKRTPPAYAFVVKAMMIFLCAVAAFLALTILWGILVLAAVGAATYFLFLNFNMEFEYLVINDQLTIDKIMGKSRRKKAWEGSMEEIQIIAPSDSYVLKDYERPGTKILDFSSRTPGSKTYSLVHQTGANSIKVIFEPNDKVLHCLRMRSPRKVIQ